MTEKSRKEQEKEPCPCSKYSFTGWVVKIHPKNGRAMLVCPYCNRFYSYIREEKS